MLATDFTGSALEELEGIVYFLAAWLSTTAGLFQSSNFVPWIFWHLILQFPKATLLICHALTTGYLDF